MDRVGKIVDWKAGRAMVEVGLNRECVSGSCADCQATPKDKWTLDVPWPEQPAVLGQRVLVVARQGTFRLYQWLGFFAAFGFILLLGQAFLPRVQARDSLEQRAVIVLGVIAGIAAWYGVKAWAARRPQYRVRALDSGAPALLPLTSRAGRPAAREAGTREAVAREISAAVPRPSALVGLDQIERFDGQ